MTERQNRTCPGDAEMPYPRICAHRGFNTVAPENSLPAWGAAIALGADEIEFDLWETLSRDREKTPVREAASSESKTLNRDRAKSASETSKRSSSGESHSHRMSHSH